MIYAILNQQLFAFWTYFPQIYIKLLGLSPEAVFHSKVQYNINDGGCSSDQTLMGKLIGLLVALDQSIIMGT